MKFIRHLAPAFAIVLIGCAEESTHVRVEETPGIMVATGTGDVEATELWVDRENRSTCLVQGHDAADPKDIIAGITSPLISPDGKDVYFVSEAWATSGSVQKVDIETKKVTFIIDGNSVGIIRSGENKVMLLVERALIKTDAAGESLGRDIYLWLVSPDGTSRREIGPTDDEVAQKFRAVNPV